MIDERCGFLDSCLLLTHSLIVGGSPRSPRPECAAEAVAGGVHGQGHRGYDV